MCENFERSKSVICVFVQETYIKLKTGCRSCHTATCRGHKKEFCHHCINRWMHLIGEAKRLEANVLTAGFLLSIRRTIIYVYNNYLIYMYYLLNRQSQWPCGLRRRSAAARLLRLWVRIPSGAWMSVCFECFVLFVEDSATEQSLVQRDPTYCGASLCVWSKFLVKGEALANWELLSQNNKKKILNKYDMNFLGLFA